MFHSVYYDQYWSCILLSETGLGVRRQVQVMYITGSQVIMTPPTRHCMTPLVGALALGQLNTNIQLNKNELLLLYHSLGSVKSVIP